MMTPPVHHASRFLPAAVLFLWLFLVVPSAAFGQNSHYWSNQYGNRSMLLSGAVIGGVSDLGAVFYNPGRLAQIENPAFILTAKVYQWDGVKVDDALGDNVDLSQSGFGGAPNLVAGTFEVPFLEGHQFAYSFMTRHRADLDFFLREENYGELLPIFPGEEYFLGVFSGRSSLKEEWMGLTWAHPLSPRVSFGVTTFYYNMRRSQDIEIDMRVLKEDNSVAIYDRERSYSMKSQGLLWKAGLSVDWAPVVLGLSFTTPQWHITGGGSTTYDDFLANVNNAEGEGFEDTLVSSVQRDLPVTHHSPWAVGGGLAVDVKRVTLYGSAEYYSAVDRIAALEAEPFEGQSTGTDHEFRIAQELQAVFNYGIGLAWEHSETFSAFGSLSTDKSAAPDDVSRLFSFADEVDMSTTRTDFLHLGFGFSWESRWADLTLGATRAWAEEQAPRPVNLPEEGGDSVLNPDELATFKVKRWRFLLGFSIPFAEEMRKRAGGEG